MNLSDNEKRDIVKYLEAGKSLPEKYRFLLFDDDREVELLWNGKTSEVTNVVLPFQTIEQIDEPRSEGKIGIQDTLFDNSGRQITGWTNKLIWGDNKLTLSSLKNGSLKKEIDTQGGLKLIYIDPPFDVGADFSMDIEIGDETYTKQPSVIEEIAYRDTWGKGADSFVAMIYERLKLMHGLLSDDGTIYVHCDWRVNSYMRLILDEIFGSDNFRNEIAWCTTGASNVTKDFPKKHDTILRYSKSDTYIFNKDEVRIPYAEGSLDRANRNVIASGGMSFDEIKLNEGGKVPEDWWIDIQRATRYPNEPVGYPTQKSIKLLERIIRASSNEGDLVGDFFCGSGTTLAVAEKLGRKWIGSDLGRFGIHTTRKRMIEIQRQLKKESKNFRAFEILNIGRYERGAFLSTNEDLRKEERIKQVERKEKEFTKLILTAYRAEPIESFKAIVGKKKDRLIAVGPINLPVSNDFINEVVKECVEGGMTKVDVLGFDYEMGLDFQTFKDKGVDVAFKIIPNEVFDKRAVEKGQVKFYDVAYLEAEPIIRGKGKVKELAIELTDFSASYSQDDIDEIIKDLKPGGSKIILDTGNLIKVTKDKKTEEVTKDILTKKWSDWIDYWAVDFDFSDRKSITGDYVFDNEWQSFRTKKNRNLELISAYRELPKGSYKVAVKVVDIFGNDTTKVIQVQI